MTHIVKINKSYPQDYSSWLLGHDIKLKAHSVEFLKQIDQLGNIVLWKPVIDYHNFQHVVLRVDFYFPDSKSDVAILFKITFG